jgi:hypothetical protein
MVCCAEAVAGTRVTTVQARSSTSMNRVCMTPAFAPAMPTVELKKSPAIA